MSLIEGTRLGPYQILGILGAGGMGEVYRAMDARLGREVAIKVLPSSLAGDQDFLARFEKEARAASALSHPNVVTVFDVGREGDVSFFAMELVKGESLRELLTPGPLPLKRALAIATPIAEGLAAAHERGIVHRDLKPENVLISRDGHVKILDFGLARTMGPFAVSDPNQPTLAMPHDFTRPGTVLGTLGYMSPEQASGKQADFRADQFSFGSVFYEMVSGRRAFVRETPAETLTAVIREEPESLAAIDPKLPVPVRWIVEQCLSKEPGDRYASTHDLAHDLKRLRDHLGQSTDLSIRGLAATEPRPKPWPRLASLAAAVAVGLVAGGALVAWRVGPAAVEPPRFTYLTSSGYESGPAVSPDGKTVAFVSERDGKPRIWLKQVQGGNEIALTEGRDRAPRFAPDGGSILFVRSTEKGSTLYRVGVLGGEARRFIDDVVTADFSPDGQRVAFIRPEPTTGAPWVMVANVDGSGEKVLAKPKGLVVDNPRWSPDGKWIAASHAPGGSALTPLQVLLVRADGSAVKELAIGESSWLTTTLFSKDGKKLVYGLSESWVRGSALRFVVRDLATDTLTTLFRGLGYGQTLDVGPTGEMVAVESRLTRNLAEYRVGSTDPPRWLTRGQAEDRQPVYSPDGTRIVFSSGRDDNLDLWEVSVGSCGLRRITDHASVDWDPYLTRDGKGILFSSRRSGTFEIWSAEPDGSRPAQVTRLASDCENPSTTPDGDWIVFGNFAGDPQKNGIWKVRRDGSEPHHLFRGLIGSPPELSPDGRWVAVTTGQFASPTVIFVSVEDGRLAKGRIAVPVASLASSTFTPGRGRWMAGGRFAFLGNDEKGRPGVFAQTFDPEKDTSKTRVKLAGFEEERDYDSFDVSPDGTRAVISIVERRSDLVRISGLAALAR